VLFVCVQALHDECLRGAKYLSRLLEALGAEVKMAQPYEGKNPVVLGRLGHNPAYPTVAFYGHYDVQVGRLARAVMPILEYIVCIRHRHVQCFAVGGGSLYHATCTCACWV
jgi:hypothetical protein